MKPNEVPQDESQTYEGHKRLLYAQAESGEYKSVTSSGWETEEFVTRQAVVELEQLAQRALKDARDGKTSPLCYHMYHNRLDLITLAQATGFFRWKIKRHFTPRVFCKLPDKVLQRYCDAMGLDLMTIKGLPD